MYAGTATMRICLGSVENQSSLSLRSFGASALFKWKPGPSLDSEASSSWLHHGDLSVMDGCCQDDYLHCTEPLQGRERVNITVRWFRNHVPRCPLSARVVRVGVLLSVVLLALLGWGFSFLVALFPLCLGLSCRASSCFCQFGWVPRGFGRGSKKNSGSMYHGWICLVRF